MAEGGNKKGRDKKGRFAPGNPGGPGGPRRRSCELRRAAEEAISPEYIAAIVRKATRMALEGNLPAMRFVCDQTIGKPMEATVEGEPLSFTLPRLNTVKDCHEASGRLLDAICEGTVDQDRAKLLVSAIETRMKAIELTELEERLTQLEQTTEQATGRRR